MRTRSIVQAFAVALLMAMVIGAGLSTHVYATDTNSAHIDLNKARVLYGRKQKGELLAPDEQSYLNRAGALLQANSTDKAGPETNSPSGPAAASLKFPPTFPDVKYGPHDRNTLDFWQAKSSKPTPLLIYIHGGGFAYGDKHREGNRLYLGKGISFASLNYRLCPEVIFPAPFMDCALALKFIRSKAKEWNIDPQRIACTGESAGGGISLWLAFHDDMADPKSDDPVARCSTRLSCAAVMATQTSYDPRFIKSILPAIPIENSARLYGLNSAAEVMSPSPDTIRLYEEVSPIHHLTADDPPVCLSYTAQDTAIHDSKFGKVLKEKMDEMSVECVFLDGKEGHAPLTQQEFLIKHLLGDHSQ